LVVFVIVNASATIINVPDDYETIHAGIDASSDGDTALVQPGTYVLKINFNGHNPWHTFQTARWNYNRWWD